MMPETKDRVRKRIEMETDPAERKGESSRRERQ